jgi:hypothetical protein
VGYVCTSCGEYHSERPTCWKFDAPAVIAELPEKEFQLRVELGTEQCVLDDQHFFMLANLDVPIRGSEEFLRWTVWGTLSQDNFQRASDLWETPGRESEEPYFSWLSNQIPGYPPSVNIKALLITQPVGIRPRIMVIEEAHPLTMDQRDGITRPRTDALIHASIDREDE